MLDPERKYTREINPESFERAHTSLQKAEYTYLVQQFGGINNLLDYLSQVESSEDTPKLIHQEVDIPLELKPLSDRQYSLIDERKQEFQKNMMELFGEENGYLLHTVDERSLILQKATVRSDNMDGYDIIELSAAHYRRNKKAVTLLKTNQSTGEVMGISAIDTDAMANFIAKIILHLDDDYFNI